MKTTRRLAMMAQLAVLLFLAGTTVFAGVGNVNNKNGIELADAVLSLQISAGSDCGRVIWPLNLSAKT